MTNTGKDIRNSNGSLLCKASYYDGLWTVTVKKDGVFSFIKLFEDGDMSVEHYSADKTLKELEYSIAIPE